MNIKEENKINIKKILKDLEKRLIKEQKIKEKIYFKYKNNLNNSENLIAYLVEKNKKEVDKTSSLKIYIKIVEDAFLENDVKNKFFNKLKDIKIKYYKNNPLIKLNNELIYLDEKEYMKALVDIEKYNFLKFKKEEIKQTIKKILEQIRSLKLEKENKNINNQSKSENLKEEYKKIGYIKLRNNYLDTKHIIESEENSKSKLNNLYKKYEDVFNNAFEKYIKYINELGKENGFNSYFEYKFREDKLKDKILINLKKFYEENNKEIDNIFNKLFFKKDKNINKFKIINKDKIKEELLKTNFLFEKSKIERVLVNTILIYKKDKTKSQKCINLKEKFVIILNIFKKEENKIFIDFNGLIHEFTHSMFLNIRKEKKDKNISKLIQETIAILSEILFFESGKNQRLKIKEKEKEKEELINNYIFRLFNIYIKPINQIVDIFKKEKNINVKVSKKNIDTYINYFIQPYIDFNHLFAAVLAINIYNKLSKLKKKEEKEEYIQKIIKYENLTTYEYFENLKINIEDKKVFDIAFKYFKNIKNI